MSPAGTLRDALPGLLEPADPDMLKRMKARHSELYDAMMGKLDEDGKAMLFEFSGNGLEWELAEFGQNSVIRGLLEHIPGLLPMLRAFDTPAGPLFHLWEHVINGHREEGPTACGCFAQNVEAEAPAAEVTAP